MSTPDSADMPSPHRVAILVAAEPAAPPQARLTLIAAILGSSIAFVSGSIATVALPSLERSTGASAAELAWVLNAYLLPLSAMQLIGGAAGDRYGRRRLMMIGLGVFFAASTLCAAAQELPMLLIGRALQGVGGAMLIPNSLALLSDASTGGSRGSAVGAWAAASTVSGAIGPLLGGWLVDEVGWRAIFLVGLPIGGVAWAILWRFVAESRSADRTPLDWGGASLATVGLGGAVWAVTLWSSGAGGAQAPLTAGLAGALLIGFVLHERRRGDRAMMPLAMFGSRSFAGLTLVTLLTYCLIGGLTVLVPYVLIEAAGYSALAAGSALLPFSLVVAVASPGMGHLAVRVGTRSTLTVAALVAAGGFMLLGRIEADTAYVTTVLPALLLIALGIAGSVAPLTTAVLTSVDAAYAGTASGFSSSVARSGGLVATALSGSVLAQSGATTFATAQAAAAVGAAVALAAAIVALTLPQSRAAVSRRR